MESCGEYAGRSPDSGRESGWDPSVGQPAQGPVPPWMGTSAARSTFAAADALPDRRPADRSGPPEAPASVPTMAIQSEVRSGGRLAAPWGVLPTGLTAHWTASNPTSLSVVSVKGQNSSCRSLPGCLCDQCGRNKPTTWSTGKTRCSSNRRTDGQASGQQ